MIITNIFITTLILATTCQQVIFFWYNYVDQRSIRYYLELLYSTPSRKLKPTVKTP